MTASRGYVLDVSRPDAPDPTDLLPLACGGCLKCRASLTRAVLLWTLLSGKIEGRSEWKGRGLLSSAGLPPVLDAETAPAARWTKALELFGAGMITAEDLERLFPGPEACALP